MSLLTTKGFQEKIREYATACVGGGRRGHGGVGVFGAGNMRELARRTGLCYRTLNAWGNGRCTPHIKRIEEVFALCEAACLATEHTEEQENGKTEKRSPQRREDAKNGERNGEKAEQNGAAVARAKKVASRKDSKTDRQSVNAGKSAKVRA